MLKFFIYSFLIHACFLAYFVFHREKVIEDPILFVELNSVQNLDKNQAPRKNPVLPKKASIKSGPSPQPNSNPDPAPSSSPVESTSSEKGDPLESQLVTKKPRVLHQEKVDYPIEAETARIEGAVKLSVIVNSQGQVEDVKILEGPGYGLNEAAANALKKFRFSPAEKDGETVSVRLTYIYRFRLDSR